MATTDRASAYLRLMEDSSHGVSYHGDRYAGLCVEVSSTLAYVDPRTHKRTYSYRYRVAGRRMRRADAVTAMAQALADLVAA